LSDGQDPAAPSTPAAPGAAPAPRSELALRVGSGLVMAGLALGTAWLGGWAFGLFWTLAAMLAMREWLTLVGLAGGRRQVGWLLGSLGIAYAGLLAEASAAADPLAWLAVVVAGAAVALAAPGGRRLWSVAGVAVCAVVAVVPIEVRGHPAHSLVAVLWLFCVVWGSDIAAYFAGRAIGGPKLWPRVSPKKTWSGAVGGLAGGSAAAIALVTTANAGGNGWYHGPSLVLLTLVASAVSILGDLAESALKRAFAVKDSGSLIPGHGGVLDRLDSFWAVCVLLGIIVYLTGGPG
jgi:phosphatidate cytidylyltransferase